MKTRTAFTTFSSGKSTAYNCPWCPPLQGREETGPKPECLLFEQALLHCHTLDLRGRLVAVGSRWHALTGYRAEEVLGRPFVDLLDPGDVEGFTACFARLKGLLSLEPKLLTFVRKDGLKVRARCQGRIIHQKNGPRTVLCLIHEEGPETAEAFSDPAPGDIPPAEALYGPVLDHLAEGVVVCDRNLRVLRANPAALRIAGISRSRLAGFRVPQDLDPRSADIIRPYIEKMRETLTPARFSEIPLRTPAGRESVQSGWVLPVIRNGRYDGLVLIVEDVTEKKRLAEDLIPTERLAAAGKLSASVAHEINSPLQAVALLLDWVKNQVRDREDILPELQLIDQAFSNIRDTVRRLMDLCRPHVDEKEPTDINALIRQAADLTRSHLRKNGVALTMNLGEGIPAIPLSAMQFSQVMLNLFNNAVEAMEGAGGPKTLSIESTRDGDQAVIRVADTGPGLAENDLNHLFDPFYSTKREKGTGLGLSVCHIIITGHKGSIRARNREGGGAVVEIRLPLSE